MTKLLSLAAQPDAPIACDMRSADDTLAERLAEYRDLLDLALLSRETTATTVSFRLAAGRVAVESVLDLVRREAACCPFLSYEVDLEGEEIVWTTTGIGATDVAALDDVLVGAGSATESSEDLARRLTDRGGIPVIVPAVGR